MEKQTCVFFFFILLCLLQIHADTQQNILLHGNVTVRLRNVRRNEPFYAAGIDPGMVNRRHVFTRRTTPTENTDDELWQVIHLSDKVIRLKSVKYSDEYLFAETDRWKFDIFRRQVFTRKASDKEISNWDGEADWLLEWIAAADDGFTNRYSLKNKLYGEYIYAAADDLAASNDSRNIFTWFDKNEQEWNQEHEWHIQIQNVSSEAFNGVPTTTEKNSEKTDEPPGATSVKAETENPVSVRAEKIEGHENPPSLDASRNIEEKRPSENLVFRILSATFGLLIIAGLILSMYIFYNYRLIRKSRNGNDDIQPFSSTNLNQL